MSENVQMWIVVFWLKSNTLQNLSIENLVKLYILEA